MIRTTIATLGLIAAAGVRTPDAGSQHAGRA